MPSQTEVEQKSNRKMVVARFSSMPAFLPRFSSIARFSSKSGCCASKDHARRKMDVFPIASQHTCLKVKTQYLARPKREPASLRIGFFYDISRWQKTSDGEILFVLSQTEVQQDAKSNRSRTEVKPKDGCCPLFFHARFSSALFFHCPLFFQKWLLRKQGPCSTKNGCFSDRSATHLPESENAI